MPYSKEKKAAWDQRRKTETKAAIYAYLRTHPCVDCGYADIRALEFDHVRGKEFTIGQCGTMSPAKVMREIERCEVRCCNCHRIRHNPIRGSMSKAGQFPLGLAGSEKVNVAVQRPTVNVREAENVGEEMSAVTRQGQKNNLTKSGWGGGHVHDLWNRE